MGRAKQSATSRKAKSAAVAQETATRADQCTDLGTGHSGYSGSHNSHTDGPCATTLRKTFHAYVVLMFFQSLGLFFSWMMGYMFELMCTLFKSALQRQQDGTSNTLYAQAFGSQVALPVAIVLSSFACERLTGLIYDATARRPYRRLRATFLLCLTPGGTKLDAVAPDANTAYCVDILYVACMLFTPILFTVARQHGLLGGQFEHESFITNLAYNGCHMSILALVGFLVADVWVHIRFDWAEAYLNAAGDSYPRLLETRGHGFDFDAIMQRAKRIRMKRPSDSRLSNARKRLIFAGWICLTGISTCIYMSSYWDNYFASIALKLMRLACIFLLSRMLFFTFNKSMPVNFVVICGICVSMALLVNGMFDAKQVINQALIGGETLVTGVLQNQPGGDMLDYPVCHSRWPEHADQRGDLTTFDASIMANLAYIHTEQHLVGNVTAAFENHPLGVPNVTNIQPWQTCGRWMRFEFEANIDVFAFRGSATTLDFITDMEMWMRVKTFAVADLLFPLLTAMPVEVKRNLIRGDSGWMVDFFGLQQPWIAPCKAVAEAKAHAEQRGHALLVVGHSLGGGFASICAAKLGLPAVMLSPPGTGLSSYRFGIEAAEHHLTAKKLLTIVPDYDVVPTADQHQGTIQRISCDAADPGACHSGERTLCELWHSCGDTHKRDLRSVCNKYK